jgi:methylglyoxal synthase
VKEHIVDKVTIAMIAHDGKKPEMMTFARRNKKKLGRFKIVATGTTGTMLIERVGLEVELVLSGPYGGDAQIAARVATEEIKAVFFFVDPLNAHPHDPDIQGLLRVCNVHNVPLATNTATAELLLKGL